MVPAAAAAQAVERSVRVSGHRVGMSVTVLPIDERDRTAASIAWLAHSAHHTARESLDTFISEVVGKHVAFTIDDEALQHATRAWWANVVRAATTAFVEVNQLEFLLQHHIGRFDCRSAKRAN